MYLRRVYSLVPSKTVKSDTMKTNNMESRSGGMQTQICKSPPRMPKIYENEFMSRQKGIATMRRTGMDPVQIRERKLR